MKRYTSLIIDDNELDRLNVSLNLKRYPQFDVLGIFESAVEALPFIQKHKPDVLFLDIDMPELSGLELRKSVSDVPVCVFISAHPEHALDAFGLDTLDFILKPLTANRLSQTIVRIEDYMSVREKANLFEAGFGGESIFIKDGTEQHKVALRDILYLEALKDYTRVVTGTRKYFVLSNIGNLIKEENMVGFVRVHRSFAVHKTFVRKVVSGVVTLHDGTEIPIGRSYKDNLKQLL
ncbi:LytTR family DNA-binding domain-containing protein [Flavobacterium sp.]|uniref:LytR/AlgR family response regulator transcription factor n=1 Tax=Flavobacterium sp. TaxID=239 RepID=UPI0012228516|nr:LytTR family DNA-binding domain-containing protein [Flavobacterium sp.]RZJ70395.1 MAG: response regulator transcription factor [Flavobacterium sp.]